MNLHIKELDKIYRELINKQYKTKEDIENQEKIGIALDKALSEETALLVQELNSLGLNISSVWDLVNTKETYQNAIPILINHLKYNYHDRNKEGIVRALAVKEAIGKATSYLIDEYQQIPKDNMLLRWSIGNAIYITITEDDVESILPIVQDKTNGISRQMFVAALGKIKSEKAEDVLIDLLNDEEMTLWALKSLTIMKSKKAKEKILLLTSHTKALIKKEAQKALKKIP